METTTPGRNPGSDSAYSSCMGLATGIGRCRRRAGFSRVGPGEECQCSRGRPERSLRGRLRDHHKKRGDPDQGKGLSNDCARFHNHHQMGVQITEPALSPGKALSWQAWGPHIWSRPLLWAPWASGHSTPPKTSRVCRKPTKPSARDCQWWAERRWWAEPSAVDLAGSTVTLRLAGDLAR